MRSHAHSRREFLVTSAGILLRSTSLSQSLAESGKGGKPLLIPKHDEVICLWTPRHPRHDHQLIFPLSDAELMLVWCEYYTKGEPKSKKKGQGGIGDEVSCQITSMTSTDVGCTWGNRKVIQENIWKHNVKHPNLIRISPEEILFTYVGWDSPENRNVYMRRSTDNCQSFGEQQQISEPGWYCNNADRAIRLSTGRVILPAHGPFDEKYIGGTPYKGGDLHSFVWYSDDGGHQWKRSSDSMTAKGRGCHEPTIVELNDGRLHCLLRNTNQKQYFSISEDGGDHWSKPEPTALVSPESPAIVKRIPTTGDLLVLWNQVASKSNWPRTPLTAAISRDEGQTWSNFCDIDNRSDFDAAYPSVTFHGNEALVTYYTRSTKWKRDSEVTLRIFDVDQFYR
ncbi:hypothetical protein Pla110_39780 [Polystyrenella longa]|uniref:Sialidase domain-containing protein n=1 Tax=Polystyrenella longa TaxID=2528007 RepID=A0A518CSM1_9PLAN|nr:sialidase family protein [Polystyrenella longa]QDU82223.1 hypothetical protein Pla110_39780 [Polystyrenella longa]